MGPEASPVSGSQAPKKEKHRGKVERNSRGGRHMFEVVEKVCKFSKL